MGWISPEEDDEEGITVAASDLVVEDCQDRLQGWRELYEFVKIKVRVERTISL